MKITCWDLNGQRIVVEVESSDTIAQVRDTIGNQLEIDTSSKRLTYHGIYLQNEATLEMYSYQEKDVLYLVPGILRKVIVYAPIGRYFALELEQSKTISVIKAELEYIIGWDPALQGLYHNQQELEDEKTLDSYFDNDNSVVHCSVRISLILPANVTPPLNRAQVVTRLRLAIRLHPDMIKTVLQQLGLGYRQLLQLIGSGEERRTKFLRLLAQARPVIGVGLQPRLCHTLAMWRENPVFHQLRQEIQQQPEMIHATLDILGIGDWRLAWFVAPRADWFLQKLIELDPKASTKRK